ncbi:MAG: hypothetical protein M3063_14390 [Actinomycetota bacterium]|nr:hypothetical protein [Actinomycetota bacterium]
MSRVELTASGTAHLRRVESRAAELDHAFRAMFTAAEVTTLRRLLTRIRDRSTKEAHVSAAR